MSWWWHPSPLPSFCCRPRRPPLWGLFATAPRNIWAPPCYRIINRINLHPRWKQGCSRHRHAAGETSQSFSWECVAGCCTCVKNRFLALLVLLHDWILEVLHLIGRETSRSSRVAPPGDREGQTLAAAPSVLPPISPSSSPPEVLPTEGRGIDERGGGDLALGCSPWLLARPHGRKAAVLGWLGQRPLPGGALRPRRVSPLDGDSGRRTVQKIVRFND
jgi:hypothetical protein